MNRAAILLTAELIDFADFCSIYVHSERQLSVSDAIAVCKSCWVWSVD